MFEKKMDSTERTRAVKVNHTWAAIAGFLTALGISVLVGGIIAVITINKSADKERAFVEHLPIELTIFGGIAGLAVLVSAMASGRKDAENYLIAKATPLPIKFLNARDDVWVEGEIECPLAVRAPHFDRLCAHYHYVLKEKRTTGTGKDRRTTWVTLRDQTQSAPYRIRDGDHAISIQQQNLRYEYLPTESHSESSLSHELTYLPSEGPVSAVGVVSEDRRSLEAYQKIPLLVTPLPRHDWLGKAKWWAHYWRILAIWLLLPAAFTLLWSAFIHLHLVDPPRIAMNGWIVPLLLSVTATIGYVIMLIYNRSVTYHQRIRSAWSQVDVDLKMRHDLIPQLVEVIKGFRQHEQDLQTTLTALRHGSPEAAQRTTQELAESLTAMDQQFQTLVAVFEKYPQLKADTLHRQLFEQVTALEEKIAHGRLVFNEAVREFNEIVLSFPAGLLFRFQAHPFWSEDAGH